MTYRVNMSQPSPDLVTSLRDVLQKLHDTPYPHVNNPTPGSKKRASVTVLLRVRPRYEPVVANAANGSYVLPKHASEEDSLQTEKVIDIKSFFSNTWVQEGDPEVLFIKRAGRRGDRWSGHIALPGGKRDPEDADDLETAIRETREEIGLDLTTVNCLQVGNLPERVVTTTWGKDALMVLCPYVFLLTGPIPPLRPQPTEVAALHWIPLRALLSPSLRTREYVDTSSRMVKQGGVVAQKVLRFLLGRMMFSAVQLTPSESLYATSIPGFVPDGDDPTAKLFSGLAEGSFGVPSSSGGALAHQQPLLLWGLTLGVLADFLDMLPPYNAVSLWKYPTYTMPDLRLLVYLITRPVRKNNAGDLSTGSWPSQTAVDATTQAMAVTEAEPRRLAHNGEVGIGGLGVGSHRQPAVGKLLSGYYERMSLAIGIFLAYRAVLGSAALYWGYRAWRRRQIR
jgi:8-oxo-dGTP pyrophosphatase MutT (NUDIX family)